MYTPDEHFQWQVSTPGTHQVSVSGHDIEGTNLPCLMIIQLLDASSLMNIDALPDNLLLPFGWTVRPSSGAYGSNWRYGNNWGYGNGEALCWLRALRSTTLLGKWISEEAGCRLYCTDGS